MSHIGSFVSSTSKHFLTVHCIKQFSGKITLLSSLSENVNPLNLVSMLKSTIPLSIFTPSASVSMLIFLKAMLKYPSLPFIWSSARCQDFQHLCHKNVYESKSDLVIKIARLTVDHHFLKHGRPFFSDT